MPASLPGAIPAGRTLTRHQHPGKRGKHTLGEIKTVEPTIQKCFFSPPDKGIPKTAQKILAQLSLVDSSSSRCAQGERLCQRLKADLPKKGNQGRPNSTEKLPHNNEESGMWRLEQHQGTLGVGEGRRNPSSHTWCTRLCRKGKPLVYRQRLGWHSLAHKDASSVILISSCAPGCI